MTEDKEDTEQGIESNREGQRKPITMRDEIRDLVKRGHSGSSKLVVDFGSSENELVRAKS